MKRMRVKRDEEGKRSCGRISVVMVVEVVVVIMVTLVMVMVVVVTMVGVVGGGLEGSVRWCKIRW